MKKDERGKHFSLNTLKIVKMLIENHEISSSKIRRKLRLTQGESLRRIRELKNLGFPIFSKGLIKKEFII